MEELNQSEQKYGKTVQRLIDASVADRKHWLKLGDEIDRYTTSADYGFLYQEFDADLSFRARVNKASEFKQIIGPYLYPQNPDASITSEPDADKWTQLRHRVEERYADYAAKHGQLSVQMRRAVDHALTYGRAPLWCGFNARKGIVQNVFDTCAHLVQDPDAKTIEEQNWQGRQRIKPRWEVLQKFPNQKAVVEALPKYSPPNSGRKSRQDDSSCDLVSYYEVWLGVSPQNYMASMELVEGDQLGDMQAKKKYCIADGKILGVTDWEIPFFLMDEWPGTCLDLLENPGSLWPLQPMEPGMGHLRAMNYLYTLFIAKYRMMSRTPFARMTINGQSIETEQLHKILSGEHIDILNVVVNGDAETADINKYFQRIDWGDPVPGFERIWGLVAREFEKSTGLYELLYSGQTPTQIRTATAAELIESKSKTRTDAMREVTVKFMETIFRKTIFAARYLDGSDDIAKLFGPKAGMVWGDLGPPDTVAQEAQLRTQLAQQAIQQGMSPEQAEEALGPPQFVSMDSWLTEADRSVDAGSMRRLDIDAQLQNLNVALNQLGPAVVNMPGGGEFVGALAAEFTRINRFSPELQAAAAGISAKIAEAQAMQAQAAQMQQEPPPGVTQSAPTPGSMPAAGPTGGMPMDTGA